MRLALKPKVAHFAYNSGGAVRDRGGTGGDRAEVASRCANSISTDGREGTPLIDNEDGTRLIQEIDFVPRPLEQGVRAHINEARKDVGLSPCLSV